MIRYGGRIRNLFKDSLSLPKGIGKLPLLISVAYFFITAVWIFFEHAFLSGSPITKDFFWAILSAGVLFLLLVYGVSVIRISEAALKESEGRLSRFLDTSASGILVMDLKCDVSYANREAASLLGLPRIDMIGMNCRNWPCKVTHVDGSPFSYEELPFHKVARTKEAMYDVELAIQRRDGARVILSMNTAPLHDAGGEVTGIVASFHDTTALKEAEELQLHKLHLAAEQSPRGIAIADAAGRIEYANPMFLHVTGYSESELFGAMKPCPADVSPQVCEQICDAIAFGREWKGEYRNRRRNGELYWESAALSPIRDEGGAISHFLWAAEDVTKHVMAEQALRESRQRYQNLVEKIHDLVFELDPNAAFTYVNPKMRDLLGFEPVEVLGKTPFDLMPGFEAKRVADRFAPVIAGRLAFEHVEGILRHKDGRYLIFAASGVPFYGSDGSFLGWRGVARDISRLKRDEEALRQSEERFRQIFEQNEEPIFIFRSGTTEIIDANPAALFLYGYSLEELMEGGLSLFASPRELFRFEQEIRGIQPGKPLLVNEVRHIRKDGTPIIVSVHGKSILLREGEVSYCTFRNITARVRAEEEAMARKVQLVHANRMTALGTMVSGVAHEINNPNNLIMFNAPMIRSAWADADRVLESYFRETGEFSIGGLPYSEMRNVVPKLIAGLSESSVRIRNIVEKLKTFARKDKENPDCGIFLNEAIRAAVAILNHEIVKGCHNFRLDLEETLPVVKGCAQQLEQVVVNLLMNSLQALPDNSKGIRVATRVNKVSGMVEMEIVDEGVGMTPEVLRRIAEPFFSTRLDAGGLGLGLSISFSIIQDHNGTLEFTSEVGMGTTARITLSPAGPAMEGSPKVSVSRRFR